MKRLYFERLERVTDNTLLNVTEVIDQLAFNEQGLIPVITAGIQFMKNEKSRWKNQ